MIDARLCSAPEGRSLLVTGTCPSEMELRMTEAMSSPYILSPRTLPGPDGVTYSYPVTDMVSLEEYLEGRRLCESEITDILIDLSAAAETMRDHLLGEEYLILDDRYIYVDRYSGRLRVCACPESVGGVAEGLEALMRDIVMRVDTSDIQAMRLAVTLFGEASRKDLRLYDLKNAARLARSSGGAGMVTQAQATGTPVPTPSTVAGTPSKVTPPQVTGTLPAEPHAALEAPVQPVAPAAETGFSTGQAGIRSRLSVEDLDLLDIESLGKEAPGSDEGERPGRIDHVTLLVRIGMSQIFMLMGLGIVWAIKGRATALHALPVYIILSVCTGAYFALGLMSGRE